MPTKTTLAEVERNFNRQKFLFNLAVSTISLLVLSVVLSNYSSIREVEKDYKLEEANLQSKNSASASDAKAKISKSTSKIQNDKERLEQKLKANNITDPHKLHNIKNKLARLAAQDGNKDNYNFPHKKYKLQEFYDPYLSNFKIVVGILSADFNLKLRNAARETWLSYGLFRYKFLLDNETPELLEEQEKYGDILFIESKYSGKAYRFGEKLYRWLKYAVEHFSDAELIVKDFFHTYFQFLQIARRC